jgi:hypothetical protein
MTTLHSWLLARHREAETPVLIVDEAQALPLPVLHALGLLVNLEVGQEKLLQIVLVGQPELDDTFRRPEQRKLHQRIALRCTTAPLTNDELRSYVALRLRPLDAGAEPVLTDEAMEAIQLYSRGIFRVANLLCEHALIAARSARIRPVPAGIIEEVARRFQLDGFRPLAPSQRLTYSETENLFTQDAQNSAPPIPLPYDDLFAMTGVDFAKDSAQRTMEPVNAVGVTQPPDKHDRTAAPTANPILTSVSAVPSDPVLVTTRFEMPTPEPPREELPLETPVAPPPMHPRKRFPTMMRSAFNRAAQRTISWLLAARNKVLAASSRLSHSLHRWLNAPLGARRPRRVLGDRQA